MILNKRHTNTQGRVHRLVLGALLVGTLTVTSGCAVRKAVKVTGNTATAVVKTTGKAARVGTRVARRHPWN